MSIYQQQLQDYLASDSFLEDLVFKAELFYQWGSVIEKRFTEYQSEFYRSCRERYQREGGFRLDLTDETIKEYFEKYGSNPEMLSAILIAHWFSLSNAKINRIKHSRRNGYRAWGKLLDYILPKTDQYIIFTDSGEVRATKEGAYLVAEDGRRYEIDF